MDLPFSEIIQGFRQPFSSFIHISFFNNQRWRETQNIGTGVKQHQAILAASPAGF